MVNDLLARQMLGQQATHRLTPPGHAGRRGRGRRRDPRGLTFFQIFEQQLELPDLGGELLRRAPELHPAQQRQAAQLGVAARELGPEQGVFAGVILGAGHGRILANRPPWSHEDPAPEAL